MKRFHTKFHQNRITNPDFRSFFLSGGNFKVQHLFNQLLDRISTFCLEMFVGNDLFLKLKIYIYIEEKYFVCSCCEKGEF